MTSTKKILIICSLDGYANAVRPMQIKVFLEKNGYQVKLINTYENQKPNGLASLIKSFITTIILPKELRNRRFIGALKKRANEIEPLIRSENPDVLICEDDMESFVMTKDLSCLKILDCPAPWADTDLYDGKLTRHAYLQFRSMEREKYEKSDYVAFHWENYTRYVRQNVYNEANIVILNWGCTPKDKRAHYEDPPRIVFLGLLKGYWNNLPLLARLSKKYPIDVYGGPPLPKELGLCYKGYASSTDVLSNYQFGLVTISDDPLRRQGFSSKHLEYMNYGLPVLTPQWRVDPLLKHVSIYYDEDNFLEKVHEFSRKDRWQKMSDSCYKQAEEWRWSENLRPLLTILTSKKDLAPRAYERKIRKRPIFG